MTKGAGFWTYFACHDIIFHVTLCNHFLYICPVGENVAFRKLREQSNQHVAVVNCFNLFQPCDEMILKVIASDLAVFLQTYQCVAREIDAIVQASERCRGPG